MQVWDEGMLYATIKSAMNPVVGRTLPPFVEKLHASRAVKVNGGHAIPKFFIFTTQEHKVIACVSVK